MTFAVFALSWLASLGWYAAFGPMLFGGVTVYLAAMALVMLTAAGFAIASRDTVRLSVASVLVALVIVGNTIGWSYGPPGLVRGLVYVGAAAFVLSIADDRWTSLVGLVLLASASCSALAIMGAFPPRPRVFTGPYYADVTAYLAHAAFVCLGRSCDDGMGKIRRWLGTADRGGPLGLAISRKDRVGG